jgi:murein DD-endopeptidase MepM/ murein hydrolase activator NlpD
VRALARIFVTTLVIVLVFTMVYWCVLTILSGLMIEQLSAMFPGMNPIPMLEWFFNKQGAALLSTTDVSYDLWGYVGPAGAIEGLPVPYPVGSHFGWSMDYFQGTRYHTGVDMACPVGTPVTNVMGGQVTFAGYSNAGYGYLVIVENQGVQSFYGHLSRIDVQVGQTVGAGDVVGASGNTGWSTGPHLHWEVRVNGVPVDPLQAQLPGQGGN